MCINHINLCISTTQYLKLNMNTLINTLRFLLSVCVCVTDVGVAATNLRFVCKTIMCVSAFTEMAIFLFLR